MPENPTPVPPETRLDDIVVDGGALDDLARDFVEEAARPVRGRGLARWMHPVCVGVVNFRREIGEAIADGIVTRASELGIAIADAPCTPRLIIVGAADGAALAEAWVSRRPRDFRWNVSGSRDVRSALDRFKTSSDPVRWWHLSVPMYYDIGTGLVGPAVRLPGRLPPSINVYSRSQLRGRTRDDLVRSVVIVDMQRVSGLSIEQLRDYLVMVSFAQIDPAADVSAYPSILNIFDQLSETPRMTDWDEAYMRALYTADDTYRLNAFQQAGTLANVLTGANEPEGLEE